MGNTRSASFEVDHLPGDVTPTRQSRKRFSFNGEEESDEFKPRTVPRPHSMYADVYAESSVSENSSKESETMSTLSSTSTAENIPSLADRYKTAPSRISGPAIETGPETGSRKTKSMHHHSSPESFFDAIFATIEQEAGKKSPNPPRRREQTMAKKRWSSMLS
jgi:hypothetical protein